MRMLRFVSTVVCVGVLVQAFALGWADESDANGGKAAAQETSSETPAQATVDDGDDSSASEPTETSAEAVLDEQADQGDTEAETEAGDDANEEDANEEDADEEDADEEDADEDAAKSDERVVMFAKITIEQDYSEGPTPEDLFGTARPRLNDLIMRLDKLAKDDEISGVLLRVRMPQMGFGKIEELRSAIARVRKSGKRVYAEVESATTKDYLMACACDEIFMPPSGSLLITGMQAEVTFYKGLLERIGVTADFIQMGQFKGAAEPYTRSDMSPEFRKQFESVIDDYYEQLVDGIACGRELDPKLVESLIDEGLFTAQRAKEAGLIDRICYTDEIDSVILGNMRADRIEFDDGYDTDTAEIEVSGFAGFMKLFGAMGQSSKRPKRTKHPKIAIIYAVGAIVSGEAEPGLMGGQVMGSDTIVAAIRTAKENDQVKAVVLRVNSPGGSALASDLIWREIEQLGKPIVASMGDVAASGGYYISMGADKIFAEAGTLTGSIGVVGGKFAIRGMLEKVGVTTAVIRRGENSGTFSMIDPFTKSERAAWRRLMAEIYRQFTAKAAAGRKMSTAQIEELAAGRIFTGRMAVQNGLVDQVGTLHDAIAEARKIAGIDDKQKVELLILPRGKTFLEVLMSRPTLSGPESVLGSDIVKQLGMVQLLRTVFKEPVAMLMPWQVEIR